MPCPIFSSHKSGSENCQTRFIAHKSPWTNSSNPISPDFRGVIAKSRLFAITESLFDSDFAAFDIRFFEARFPANKRYRFRPKLIQPDIETAFFDSQAVQKAHRRFHALAFRGVVRLSLRGARAGFPEALPKERRLRRIPAVLPGWYPERVPETRLPLPSFPDKGRF